MRRDVLRVLVAANLALGTYYLAWRWTSSVNWSAWWIAVPLILAETYSYLDAWLFGLTMWRLKERGAAPPPPPDATVDVFITCYNEPIELVRGTARAARDIRHPHRTYVLDDGASPEMAAMAAEEGVGYITRSADWHDRPRHAKAGNLNNALFQTDGEFLLILDADQIPDPAILDRTLGWFTDPQVALVQTPQYFVNVDDADPMGSQAPLFYGPIQQGKDGWNAAFFCGSNAILRREALMQLGIVGYVRDVETALRRVLRTADRVVGRARAAARERGDEDAAAALEELAAALREVRAGQRRGLTTQEVTHAFRREVDRISRGLVDRDVRAIQADLEALGPGPVEADAETGELVLDEAALDGLAVRDLSPLGAIESVRRIIADLDAVQAHEAQPVMPMATISVTEDMATAMRLHGLGWRSVYHHEILAHGLAPEDLRSMLAQRLRWSQGTMQVMLRENPLRQPGLSVGQRLMYFATMWTYLSGFAAVVYLAAPIVYLLFGVLPVRSLGADFMWHLLPYLLVNQLLFLLVGWGMRTWRGQQYSLALFPLWIQAVTSVVRNQLTGRDLGFVVTPKTRQAGASLRLVRVQVATMLVLCGAVVIGLVRLMVGATDAGGAIMLNVAWVVYDLISLSVVVDAAFYRGFAPQPDPQEA
ncbi:glycosyltransferase [Patulibacter sp. SYSU D01012]|uniref:glycosyltransferase family 2 protein n=1 Tax=Patulibacter sp. SYSU D01012 TaxID=2817381 RepID=UPI0032BF7B50